MQIDAIYTAGTTRIRASLDHPMESGERRDRRGGLISANYIREFEIRRGEAVLLSGDWTASLSRNPYLAVDFDFLKVGDTLSLHWVDTSGKEHSRSVTVRTRASG